MTIHRAIKHLVGRKHSNSKIQSNPYISNRMSVCISVCTEGSCKLLNQYGSPLLCNLSISEYFFYLSIFKNLESFMRDIIKIRLKRMRGEVVKETPKKRWI